ncbi:MAG: hypothetical protein WAM69_10855 [Candidatus Sulfotelmatobacter sp.]
MRDRIVVLILFCLFARVTWGQQPAASSAAPSAEQNMPGMDMSGHDMSTMQDQNQAAPMGDKDSDAGMSAMHSMEGHMHMGPHMKMTALRPPKPGDAERAQQVVEAARRASGKYIDYHVALADGFKIFHPEIPQPMYHFTNSRYALEAAFRFNPEHPTSLLYEKHGADYKLVGVMYTAPRRFSEDQLDARVPLSFARWHQHVNFCLAPLGHWGEYRNPHPQFGMRGSITTREACDAAGGTFIPVVFGWMVHVYPFEKDQASIWSVDRQHGDGD